MNKNEFDFLTICDRCDHKCGEYTNSIIPSENHYLDFVLKKIQCEDELQKKKEGEL